MAGEWQTERFGRMAQLVRDTIDPSEAAGFPYIGLEHIGAGSLSLLGNGLAEDATSLKNRFRKGDILFGKLRPYFRKVIRAPFAGICSTDIWVVRPRPRVDAGFLFYLMASDLFVQPIVRASEGTRMPRAQWQYASALELPLPPLSEQRAIAHILGTLDDELSSRGGERAGMRRVLNTLISKLVSGTWSVDQGQAWLSAARSVVEPLDDKIELNRRMSETLEAMARALFKAWFVDFEPVRAKMEGRWRRGESLPGLPAHLYDLFPDRLVDSELGEIPEGWEVGRLDELAEIQGGRQLPTEECRPTGRYPVFGANGVMGYTEHATHGGFVIAFGRVGAYCGSVHWTYRGAWVNNNASSILPRRWPEFVLEKMLATDFQEMRTGSAQPFISNSVLAGLLLVRASDQVLDLFCSLVRPLRLQEQAFWDESRTLAALRDALLPKLVSGELRVKDAERFLEERGL